MDSVVKQTLSNIEIICVDDGSTDNSLDMLSKYAEKDDRITILSQENQYAGVARNNGLEFARGKYVIFLDSDDFFELDMLELIYNKSELEQAEICVFASAVYNTKTSQISPSENSCMHQFVSEQYPTISGEMAGKYVFMLSHAIAWNKLYLRELISKYNLEFQDTRTANDLSFVYTCFALAERITFLNETLLYYRVGTGTSLCDTKYDYGEICTMKALDELRNNLIKYNLYDCEEFKISFINISCYKILLNFINLKNMDMFEKLYFWFKDKLLKEYDTNLLNVQNISNKKVYNLIQHATNLGFDEFVSIYKKD